MRRRRDCLLVTRLGAAVLHSKRRPRVIPVSVRLRTPLYAYLLPVSLSHCTPPTAFLRLSWISLETRINQRRVPLPTPISLPHSLCHDKPLMFIHDHVLSPQCLHFTAPFPFSCTRLILDTRFAALLVPHRHFSYPFTLFLPLPPFSFLVICPNSLNYRFTTVYGILFVCAVWFVVYLTLSFLSDVADRSGTRQPLDISSPLFGVLWRP